MIVWDTTSKKVPSVLQEYSQRLVVADSLVAVLEGHRSLAEVHYQEHMDCVLVVVSVGMKDRAGHNMG